MERIVRIQPSHAAAAEVDLAEIAAMMPQQRLDRALQLTVNHREALGEAGQGLARVARIVPFERG